MKPNVQRYIYLSGGHTNPRLNHPRPRHSRDVLAMNAAKRSRLIGRRRSQAQPQNGTGLSFKSLPIPEPLLPVIFDGPGTTSRLTCRLDQSGKGE